MRSGVSLFTSVLILERRDGQCNVEPDPSSGATSTSTSTYIFIYYGGGIIVVNMDCDD